METVYRRALSRLFVRLVACAPLAVTRPFFFFTNIFRSSVCLAELIVKPDKIFDYAELVLQDDVLIEQKRIPGENKVCKRSNTCVEWLFGLVISRSTLFVDWNGGLAYDNLHPRVSYWSRHNRYCE